jgi:hypothetical protein
MAAANSADELPTQDGYVAKKVSLEEMQKVSNKTLPAGISQLPWKRFVNFLFFFFSQDGRQRRGHEEVQGESDWCRCQGQVYACVVCSCPPEL